MLRKPCASPHGNCTLVAQQRSGRRLWTQCFGAWGKDLCCLSHWVFELHEFGVGIQGENPWGLILGPSGR